MAKTVRVDCGRYRGHNDAMDLANSMFGLSGTQAGRKWFYRILEKPGTDWRRVGRRSNLQLVLYFRNSADATFFCLKKSQK